MSGHFARVPPELFNAISIESKQLLWIKLMSDIIEETPNALTNAENQFDDRMYNDTELQS
jgi:hypothetical protein